MPYPDVTDFANWDRAQQLAYLNNTYGSVDSRAAQNGLTGAYSSPKFRRNNTAQPWVSPDEQALWAQVKPDRGTFAGNLLSSAAPYALAAGTLATGASALGAFGGAGAASGTGIFGAGGAGGLAGVGAGNAGALAASGGIAGGAGVGTSIGGLLGAGGSMGFWDGLIKALPAIGSVVGGVAQGRAAGRAADVQQAGAQAGIDEQRREFDLIQGMLAPQQQLGRNAINTLSRLNGYDQGSAGSGAIGSTGIGVNGAGGITQGAQASGAGSPDMSAFYTSPDYQFRRDEGNRDINNSFAARGGALSGNALRGITDYNSNLASGEFNNFYQRRLQEAGLGGAATSQGVNAAQYTGGNVANLLGQQGNARASGIVDQSNALTGGLNDLSSWFGDWLKKRNPTGGGAYPGPYG